MTSEELVPLSIGVGFSTSAALAYPIYRGLIALKSRQTVSQYLPGHQAKQGTPTMGGLIIVVGLLAGLSIDLAHNLPLIILIAGFALIGFVDDFLVPRLIKGKRGLGWAPKLLGQVLATWLFLAFRGHGVGLGFLSDPLQNLVLPIFVILFCSNAFNFADGLDWLAGGIGILIAAGYFGMLVSPTSFPVLSLLLIVCLVPFMFLNRPPAKLFMGDAGSLPIGAVLGVLAMGLLDSLRDRTPNEQWKVLVPVVLLNLVLAIELIPVPLQIASVKLRKKRLPFKTPIHHTFEDMGWPEGRIVFAFCFVQMLLSGAAIAFVRTVGLGTAVF